MRAACRTLSPTASLAAWRRGAIPPRSPPSWPTSWPGQTSVSTSAAPPQPGSPSATRSPPRAGVSPPPSTRPGATGRRAPRRPCLARVPDPARQHGVERGRPHPGPHRHPAQRRRPGADRRLAPAGRVHGRALLVEPAPARPRDRGPPRLPRRGDRLAARRDALGLVRGPAAGRAAGRAGRRPRRQRTPRPRLPPARRREPARGRGAARELPAGPRRRRGRPAGGRPQGRAARRPGAERRLGHAGPPAGTLRSRARAPARAGPGGPAPLPRQPAAPARVGMTGERCIFWVQSLLGSGHLRRALTLAGGLARDGLEVTLANGGPPPAFPIPPGVPLVQLPAVRSASVDFARLVTSDGEAVGPEVWRARRELLAQLLGEVRPQVLVTELFPFGRGAFREEV